MGQPNRWIKEILSQNGNSQRELAAALNLPPSRVTDMVVGRRAIQTRERQPMMQFLGLTPREFDYLAEWHYDDEDPPYEPEDSVRDWVVDIKKVDSNRPKRAMPFHALKEDIIVFMLMAGVPEDKAVQYLSEHSEQELRTDWNNFKHGVDSGMQQFFQTYATKFKTIDQAGQQSALKRTQDSNSEFNAALKQTVSKTAQKLAQAGPPKLPLQHTIQADSIKTFPPKPGQATIEHIKPAGFTKDLPILGGAQGGVGQMVVSQNPIELTFRPPQLDGVKDAFAVYVSGESMVPKYEPGALLWINPSKPPRNGDYVLIEMGDPENGDHEGIVKRYWGQKDGMVRVEQFNAEPKEYTIPLAKIISIKLVVGSLEA